LLIVEVVGEAVNGGLGGGWGGCGERGFLTRINPRNEVGVGLGLMRGQDAHATAWVVTQAGRLCSFHTTGEGLPQIKHRHT